MKTATFKIDKPYKNIYYFLKSNQFSENYISNLRKSWGNFILNSEIVNIKPPLKEGDILQINSSPNPKTTIMPCILPLDIVYEDDYYLLINKPAGIPVMPSKSHYKKNIAGAICNYMSSKDPNFVLRIAGRLDKDTSGLIIVAKDSVSLNRLNVLEKKYYAICEGCIAKDMIIDKKIETLSNNGINQIKRIVSENGKEAKTFIHPIKNNSNQTLLEIKIEHGRTHQIRVHLSSVNHPLVSDIIYGTKSDLINRCALHCGEITFLHPYCNKNINIKANLPDDFFIKNQV